MIIVISQMKGSMSFSAIKVGKSSNSYGIFLWSGNDGAQLLFDTYAAEKEKWTNKLATSGAALFKSIKSKLWIFIKPSVPLGENFTPSLL